MIRTWTSSFRTKNLCYPFLKIVTEPPIFCYAIVFGSENEGKPFLAGVLNFVKTSQITWTNTVKTFETKVLGKL